MSDAGITTDETWAKLPKRHLKSINEKIHLYVN